MPFGGFVDIASHFRGEILQKKQFLGREYAFSNQTGKILKISCHRNYCIDCNQIRRNDRDHQVVIVGGPVGPNKSKMADGRHFEKNR